MKAKKAGAQIGLMLFNINREHFYGGAGVTALERTLRNIGWVVGYFCTGMTIFGVLPQLLIGSSMNGWAVFISISGFVIFVYLICTKESRQRAALEANQAEWSEWIGLPLAWVKALSKQRLPFEDIQKILEVAYSDRKSEVVPSPSEVFRAFRLTSLLETKVVILGQDPYPGVGEANGLAFGFAPGKEVPYSMGQIRAKLMKEFPREDFSWLSSGDLTPWAKQGVLLLNASLTTLEGEPGTDSNLWKPFTEAVLKVLHNSPNPIVFLLWGKPANDLVNGLKIDMTRHRLIRSTHPRRTSDSNAQTRFQDVEHFVAANRFLVANGRDPVRWARASR